MGTPLRVSTYAWIIYKYCKNIKYFYKTGIKSYPFADKKARG